MSAGAAAHTRPGKTSGDAATSAAPIAFFGDQRIAVHLFPLSPDYRLQSEQSHCYCEGRRLGVARPRLCGCRSEAAYGRDSTR